MVAILAGCGGTPPATQVPTHIAPEPTPVVVDAADGDPEPRRGALCFGGQGSTDIRTFDGVAIQIFEERKSITEIGSCRIVPGPSQSGFDEITIMAGTTPIAVLNHCGGKALVRGIQYGSGGQIGDSTRSLAAFKNLECSPDVGGYWCYFASEYDPVARYFVAVPTQTTATGGVVQGPAAVALIAGKTIAGASFTTRCD